jgi:hypothetical protein
VVPVGWCVALRGWCQPHKVSTPQIDVSVRTADGLKHLPYARTLRKTPPGFVGVVFRGVVYPVHDDHSIDPADKYSLTQDCPFVGADEPWPPFAVAADRSLDRLDWYLETNTYGHYLVFDGDEALLQAVLDRLHLAELGVRYARRSVRPADNGRSYDWFVRLVGDGLSRAQVKARIRSALAASSGELPESQTVSPPAQLVRQMERERQLRTAAEHRLAQSEAKLAEVGEALSDARERLDRVELENGRLRANAENQIDALRAQLHRAAAQRGGGSAEQAEQIAALQAERDGALHRARASEDETAEYRRSQEALVGRL